MTPRPSASVVPPTRFAERKIRTYSAKSVLFGVGIGVLIAPASGEETRADITDKVSDFADRVGEHTGKKPQDATGTHGE
jgi:hypothetical protein